MKVEVGGTTFATNVDDDVDDDDDDDDDDGAGGGINCCGDELLVDVDEQLVGDDDSTSPFYCSLMARLVASTRIITYFSSLCAALYANNIGSNTSYGVGSNDDHASPVLAPKRARTSKLKQKSNDGGWGEKDFWSTATCIVSKLISGTFGDDILSM